MANPLGRCSLAYLTVAGADPLAHIRAAAAAGFPAAGVRLANPTHVDSGPLAVPAPAVLAALKACAADEGVRFFDVEVASLRPERSVEDFRPLLAASAALGATQVLTVIEDEDRHRAIDAFAGLCSAAAEFGLGIALEFMLFRPVKTLPAALSILRAAGMANAGIVLDALHFMRSGGVPADLTPEVVRSISYLQLCDGPATAPTGEALVREAREARLFPGEGALPLRDIIAQFPASLPISVEIPHPSFGDLSPTPRARKAAAATAAFLAG